MKLLVYWIFPVLGSIFVFFCLFYGMGRMGTDRNIKRGRRCAVLAIYTLVVILLSLPGNGILNLIVLLVIPFIGNRIYHSGKKYFVYYLLLIVAVYLTDGLVVFVMTYAFNYGLLYLNPIELFMAVTIVVTRLAEFVVVQLITLLVQKNSGYAINGRQLGVSLILPAFSILNAITLAIFMQVYATETMIYLFFLNMLFLIGMNIYFTVLINTMSENQRLENELNLFRQQSKMQCDYYEREEEKYEESRRLIHDIRNHIESMEQLYRSSEANDAAEYASNIHSILNSFGQKYYTADKLLNIILNDKVHLLHQNGIPEDIKIGEVDLSFMQDVDITTLFANLLDNAIEASAECDDSFVKLRVNEVRGFLSITMENSSQKKPEKDKNGFQSKKPGHHGLGLKNICRVTKAYDGDIQFEWKDSIFYTKIMLVR